MGEVPLYGERERFAGWEGVCAVEMCLVREEELQTPCNVQYISRTHALSLASAARKNMNTFPDRGNSPIIKSPPP